MCNPLFLIALFFMLPTLIRVGAFMAIAFINVALHVAIAAGIGMLITRALPTDCDSMAASMPWACCGDEKPKDKHCEAKKKEPAMSAGDKSTKEEATSSSEHQQAKHRCLDLSCIRRFQTTLDDESDEANMITLVVAAPGVSSEDMEISVVDHVLSIKGETSKGSDVFSIDRRIALPQGADPDSASATMSDGMVTIVFKRKVGKRIAVLKTRKAPAAPSPVPEEEEKDEVSKKSMATEPAVTKSEDEWEPLVEPSVAEKKA